MPLRTRSCSADGRELPFDFLGKGKIATIGRAAAVADIRGLHVSGLPAWLLWLFVHIYFLIGFRNRVAVLLQWAWSYVTFRRGARLITDTAEQWRFIADQRATAPPYAHRPDVSPPPEPEHPAGP